jgi:hypothetical protein
VPITTVGSSFPSVRISEVIAVVVDFPCVPAMAIVKYSLLNSPRASG